MSKSNPKTFSHAMLMTKIKSFLLYKFTKSDQGQTTLYNYRYFLKPEKLFTGYVREAVYFLICNASEKAFPYFILYTLLPNIKNKTFNLCVQSYPPYFLIFFKILVDSGLEPRINFNSIRSNFFNPLLTSGFKFLLLL